MRGTEASSNPQHARLLRRLLSPHPIPLPEKREPTHATRGNLDACTLSRCGKQSSLSAGERAGVRGNKAASNPNALDSSIVSFPLTLSLSPRRGHQPCHLRQSRRAHSLPMRKTMLPLRWGEGWGEGKGGYGGVECVGIRRQRPIDCRV